MSAASAAPATAALVRSCAGRAGVDVIAWVANREEAPAKPSGAIAPGEFARALHDLGTGLRVTPQPPPLADLEDEAAALCAPDSGLYSASAAAPAALPQLMYQAFLADVLARLPLPAAVTVLASSTTPNALKASRPSSAARPPVHPATKSSAGSKPRRRSQSRESVSGSPEGSPQAGDDGDAERRDRERAASIASYTHAGVEAAHALETLLVQRASDYLRSAAQTHGASAGVGGSSSIVFMTGSLRPVVPAAVGLPASSSAAASRRASMGGSSVLSSRSSVFENHTNAQGAAPAAIEARGRSASPGLRKGGARAALQIAAGVRHGQQLGNTGPARVPTHERLRQRHAQRSQLLASGDCEGLAAMLLEDLADAMQRAPDVFTRLRRAIRAAPGYVVARDARAPAEPVTGEDGGASGNLFLLAPTIARLLADCADLRWPLPVVAVAMLRMGGKMVVAASPEGNHDVSGHAGDLDLITDYSRVVVSKATFDRVLTAFRLTGLSSRAVPAKAWAAAKAHESRTMLESSIRYFKAALASSTQVGWGRHVTRHAPRCTTLASPPQGIPAAGTPEAGAWLTRAQVTELTEAFDTVPETWAATEAAAQAESWLTTKEGRRAIAEEQAKLHAALASAGSAAPASSSSRTASYDAAAQQVLKAS